MNGKYYLVARIGNHVSIFCLEFWKDKLLLERFISSDPHQTPNYQVCLCAVCLRKGKVGFLSGPGTMVMAGLVGMFHSMREAVECWQAPALDLEDHRWQYSTDDVRADILKKNDPRFV